MHTTSYLTHVRKRVGKPDGFVLSSHLLDLNIKPLSMSKSSL